MTTVFRKKIAILLNGPAYCGKDTAANALLSLFGDESRMFRFTVPVKEETHKIYGLEVPYDHFEDKSVKDTPMAQFGGLSPRQAYIKVGDELRVKHGPDIVTRMLCERIRKSDVPIVINPDCGGDGEAEGIARELGYDATIVFRIHKDGHTYAGDSRTWVRSSGVRKIDIFNVEGQVSDYLATVREIAMMFRDSTLGSDHAMPALYDLISKDDLDTENGIELDERLEMERITLGMHAEAKNLLAGRQRKFG